MESAFLWGAVFAAGCRAGACRVTRQPLLFKCYQYPVYMLYSGVVFSFFDWIRRINLEDLCAAEDLADNQMRYARMNQVSTGAESYGDLKKEFLKIAVEEDVY